MKARKLGLIACTAAFMLVGCGDGRLDSSDLREKVSAACNKAHVALEKIKDPKTADQVTVFINQASAATAILLADLRKLRPPSDLQQEYNLAVSVLNDQSQAMKDAAQRIRTGADPVVELRSLAQANQELIGRERIAWEGLGVDNCFNR